MVKKYYKIRFELTEPLSLGSGENKYSDRDLLRNSIGQPFIPGSSLSGIYRSTLFADNESEGETYFGTLFRAEDVDSDEETQWDESKVIVYDAILKDGECSISIRDGVRLDEFKTAEYGTKFDFEILEPGSIFETYVEQTLNSGHDLKEKDIGEEIAKAYQEGQFCFGHKVMRGYGGVKALQIWVKSFDISGNGADTNTYSLEDWIDFDMYDEEAFSDSRDVWEPKETLENKLCIIDLHLCLRDGISIRRYTTDLENNEAEQPDYTQIYYIKENDGTKQEMPCIPGTSWAGAFCHHIKLLLPENQCKDIIDDYFGFSRDKQKKKSNVRFSESRIKGSKSKCITRNAIDRFTGGTIEGALYTEKTFFGGETDLTISFPKKADEDKSKGRDSLWRQALAAAITDLDLGFLAVGGLTAVGRGLFQVEECSYNGKLIYENKQGNSEEARAHSEAEPNLYRNLICALNGEEQKGAEV